jgi:hypothetical protein
MAETKFAVQVTLSNSETRVLSRSRSTGDVEVDGPRQLDSLIPNSGPLQGDWLDTDNYTIVARAHIIEAGVIQLG